VILDNHSSDAMWCCDITDGNGLWYTARWARGLGGGWLCSAPCRVCSAQSAHVWLASSACCCGSDSSAQTGCSSIGSIEEAPWHEGVIASTSHHGRQRPLVHSQVGDSVCKGMYIQGEVALVRGVSLQSSLQGEKARNI
jgi:hypothetical protein